VNVDTSFLWLLAVLALAGPLVGAGTALLIQLSRNAKASGEDGRQAMQLSMLGAVAQHAVLAIEERAAGTDWKGPVKLEAALLELERVAPYAGLTLPTTEVRVAAIDAALAGLKGAFSGGALDYLDDGTADIEQARIDADRIEHPEEEAPHGS
jgi:hypothetical protein